MLVNGLRLTDKHTGKMEGMQSLSTSCASNPNCLANSKIPGSICSHCYAQRMMKVCHNLDDGCTQNGVILSSRILPEEDIPFVNARYFRFEAFGDLINETHLENYLNIARKNPHCMFTLWTKMYDLVYRYFKTHEAPNNFTLIISSLMVNQQVDISKMKALGTVKRLKVFTVYDKKYAKDHKIVINCGGRKCLKCLRCYAKESEEEVVNELLK